MTNLPAPYRNESSEPSGQPGKVPTTAHGTILAGAVLVALMFGGLGTWAAVAPLSSAAVAPGTVIVESNRKTVQHLEGGIIRELRVENGDVVDPGDVLVVLSDIRAEATYERLMSSATYFAAREARLVAERNGDDAVSFAHPLLSDRDDPVVAKAIAAQASEFESQGQALEGRRATLGQRIAQAQRRIEGLREQITSTEEQLRLIELELRDVAKLVQKRLAVKPRLLALQRARANLLGERGELKAQIARTEESIIETRLQIMTMDADRAKEIDTELAEVQTRLAEFEERLKHSRDVLARTEVTTPVGGKVMNLFHSTIGGVVQPGEPILEIVPDEDDLIIEAEVSPLDIDVVHPGLEAEVRFTALSFRRTPSVTGEVIYVSADRIVDEASRQSFYAARVRIGAKQLESVPGLKLHPGMPVDVLIKTGERTVLNSVLAPVVDSMARSFREQ